MEGGTQDDLMIGTSKRNGFLGRSLLLAFLLAKTLAFPSSNTHFLLSLSQGTRHHIPHQGVLLNLV